MSSCCSASNRIAISVWNEWFWQDVSCFPALTKCWFCPALALTHTLCQNGLIQLLSGMASFKSGLLAITSTMLTSGGGREYMCEYAEEMHTREESTCVLHWWIILSTFVFFLVLDWSSIQWMSWRNKPKLYLILSSEAIIYKESFKLEKTDSPTAENRLKPASRLQSQNLSPVIAWKTSMQEMSRFSGWFRGSWCGHRMSR